ncbi:hypothetical protein [Corynebacterium matruchotii]|uniref:hypothetical protein n=1 Tax=Corynebacterium matruchotii TaxID=43768 RepID=UPI0028E6837C|nr:hypothetical protein [Corynebacterium matruchotii]
MPGWSRALAIAMMLWWGFFGNVSISWALGSSWLVDTVLQGDGRRLAQERLTWFVVVVFISGLVKLGFVAFGCSAHGPWIGRIRAGNREAPGKGITLTLRLVTDIPVDAASWC